MTKTCAEQCREIRGAKVVANEGDHVLMHYKYNDSTENYDQTVYLNGDAVSTLSTGMFNINIHKSA